MFKDKLHRALAHIAAGADKMAQAAQEVLTPPAEPSKETMMDNQDRAVNVIAHGMKNGDSPARIAEHLADYGLLTPDPPAPDTSLSSGEKEWDMVDGYVNLYDGEITAYYDERDEDTYLTESAPEPGEIRITDTGQGRAVAYAILAACDLKDAQDE